MTATYFVASLGLMAGIYLRNPALLIGTGLCTLFAVLLAFSARSNMQKQKRLMDTETSRTGKLKGGFAEAKGRAKPAGQLLESPLSRTRCIYYRFLVEEHVQRGKNSYWRKVIDDKQDAGLLLDDGSGPVAVRLGEAELYLKPDAHAKSGNFNQASPELEATMQAYGKTTKGWIFNKAMRYTETLLREGDELYVIGTASRYSESLFEFTKANDLFIVSDESEEQLTSKFNRGKLFGIIGGAVLGAGALAFTVGSFVAN
ncbi:MAG: GIDE domain-containing protein [Myxococcaceae bacterium]